MVIFRRYLQETQIKGVLGSDKWCKNLKEKPKGEWTANEAKDYAKHCILK
jgi:hypothetical protein